MNTVILGPILVGVIVLAVLILAFIIARDGRRPSDYSGKGVGRSTGYQARNDATRMRTRSYKVTHSKPRITPNATRKPRERIEVAMSRSYEQETFVLEPAVNDSPAPAEKEPAPAATAFKGLSMARILKRKKEKANGEQENTDKILSIKPLFFAVMSLALAIALFILDQLLEIHSGGSRPLLIIPIFFFVWYAWKNFKQFAAALKEDSGGDFAANPVRLRQSGDTLPLGVALYYYFRYIRHPGPLQGHVLIDLI